MSTADAPMCGCGKHYCPPRPSKVGYRPRCDWCERAIVIQRQRDKRARNSPKRAKSGSVSATTRAQRP